jgi:hypothetical protein
MEWWFGEVIHRHKLKYISCIAPDRDRIIKVTSKETSWTTNRVRVTELPCLIRLISSKKVVKQESLWRLRNITLLPDWQAIHDSGDWYPLTLVNDDFETTHRRRSLILC